MRLPNVYIKNKRRFKADPIFPGAGNSGGWRNGCNGRSYCWFVSGLQQYFLYAHALRRPRSTSVESPREPLRSCMRKAENSFYFFA